MSKEPSALNNARKKAKSPPPERPPAESPPLTPESIDEMLGGSFYGKSSKEKLDERRQEIARLYSRLRVPSRGGLAGPAYLVGKLAKLLGEHFEAAIRGELATSGLKAEDVDRVIQLDFAYGHKTVPAAPLERATIGQLIDAHPHLHEPLIEGLVRRSETANIISYSKIGKSWLAYGLILSFVTKRPWFNRFPTAGGRVFLIDNELHKPTIAHRIKGSPRRWPSARMSTGMQSRFSPSAARGSQSSTCGRISTTSGKTTSA
jgi:hypothetical protein